MTLISFLGGGLIIFPLLTFLGMLICLYFAVKIRNSGSAYTDKSTGKVTYTGEKMPLTSIGQFWFAVVLFVITIIILIWMYNER